jgi:hypothetical protein
MRMIKFLLIVLLISYTYSNPIFVTLINEFQTAPDSLERIELHETPFMGGPIDLSGWTIITSAGTATINSGTILPYDGYVIIDRTNTTGIFSLNDMQDSIILYDNMGWIYDMVSWHSLPARWGHAPAPPFGGSSAIYHENWSAYVNPANWYIDSTPTFNQANDDWSSISGRITNQSGQPVRVEVCANGLSGGSADFSDSLGNYTIAGLGEGKYWLRTFSFNYPQGNYPESVSVGYNQHITGINITLPFSGIELVNKSTTSDVFFSLSNPIRDNSKISFILLEKAKAIIRVYDTQGTLVRTLFNGRLNAGTHQFGLNLNTNPGIYFLNSQIGEQKAITKKLIYLK